MAEKGRERRSWRENLKGEKDPASPPERVETSTLWVLSGIQSGSEVREKWSKLQGGRWSGRVAWGRLCAFLGSLRLSQGRAHRCLLLVIVVEISFIYTFFCMYVLFHDMKVKAECLARVSSDGGEAAGAEWTLGGAGSSVPGVARPRCSLAARTRAAPWNWAT